jgi:CMP/dCMP kinase
MADGLVVAIDGPAGAGKSTVARLVARALGAVLLDTGAIYRAVALAAREAGVDWRDGPALAALAKGLDLAFRLDGDLNRVLLGGRDVTAAIREPSISKGASLVSGSPEVREALLELQRAFADSGSVVAEGRDIGTVVFPRAGLKIFLVADPCERARRRTAELRAAGREADEALVLEEQASRDAADSTRAVAPLRPAADAVPVDTTALSVEEVVERILGLARERGG